MTRIRLIVALGLGAAFVMCVYPPFMVRWQGRYVSMGYGWLFSPPSRAWEVDLARLIVQLLLLAAVIGLLALFLARTGVAGPIETSMKKANAPAQELHPVGSAVLHSGQVVGRVAGHVGNWVETEWWNGQKGKFDYRDPAYQPKAAVREPTRGLPWRMLILGGIGVLTSWLIMTVVGAILWPENRATTQFRAMLPLSTMGVFVWFYARRKRFWKSIQWTSAYAATQCAYGIIVSVVYATVKTFGVSESSLVGWAMFLGFLWTIAPLVPLLLLRRPLFAR